MQILLIFFTCQFVFIKIIKCLIIYNFIKIAIQLLMSSSTSKYKSTPTFTFKGKTKSITSTNDPSAFPSPQHYNPEKISLEKSPNAKFAMSARKQWAQIKCRQKLPGPGAYQTPSYTTQGFKKTISRVIFKKFDSFTPSPDKYNPNQLFTKKKEPSFTMQKKTLSTHDLLAQKNSNKPSPCHYQQPIVKFKSVANITMSKSIRNSLGNNQKNPGPGSYEPQKSFHSSILSQGKCKIGKQKRVVDFSLGQRSPGPGKYQKKSFVDINKLKQKGFSCRGKFQDAPSIVPGPGKYETPLIKKFKSTPSIKMVKSPRLSFIDTSISANKNKPGPGSFDIQGIDRMRFKSMSVHKFNKSKTNYLSESINAQSSKMIGPGFYKPKDLINKKNGPTYSFNHNTNRDIFRKSRKQPGPGQYNPKTSLIHEAQVSYKLQKSQRTNFIRHLQKLPGPGEYELNNSLTEGVRFKFPKQQRLNMLQSKSNQKLQQLHQTYQQRQQFPNPPKYMSVNQKLKYNEKKDKK